MFQVSGRLVKKVSSVYKCLLFAPVAVENFTLASVIIIPLIDFGRTGPTPYLSVTSSTYYSAWSIVGADEC